MTILWNIRGFVAIKAQTENFVGLESSKDPNISLNRIYLLIQGVIAKGFNCLTLN